MTNACVMNACTEDECVMSACTMDECRMEKDNSSVYFDAVPDRSTLPPVYGVVVRQSVNFVPPSKALSVQELLG